MRKNILRWVIASLVICLLTGNLAVFAETTGQNTDQTFPTQPDFIIPETVGNAAITAGCSTMDAQIPLITNEKILETAQAAILYEVNTDTLIYNWNADKKIYPGALTKVMTVLVALEKGDLEETVTVSRSVLNLLPIGTVVCKLQAGEELSLKDLLYCVMTASANDAALVVADHIAGSQEAFVDLMNQKAAQLGCTGTSFTNATGLHHAQQYTTARDLGKIILAGLDNETFKEIFSTSAYTVSPTNLSDARELNTTNFLQSKVTLKRYFDERCTGGKTGASESGGRSLVATSEVGNMTLLSIVLDAQPIVDTDGFSLSYYGNFEETKVLIDRGFEQFSSFSLLYEDQAVTQFPVNGGENSVVGHPANAMGVALPSDVDTSEFAWRYEVRSGALNAPVKKGDVIGTAQIWYRSVCIGQVDLLAMTDVAVKTAPQTGGKTNQSGKLDLGMLLMILGVVFGVILVAFFVLLGIRTVRIITVTSRRRRRRAGRRRSR